MADIYHYFPINSTCENVFELISTPKGLDNWWTKSSTGKPSAGEIYTLYFSPEYKWQARVSKYIPNLEFELTMTNSDDDWINSKIGFKLVDKNDNIDVQFCHTGWKEDNDHYRISNYCWAMYLRILKRYAESGEIVVYEERLNV